MEISIIPLEREPNQKFTIELDGKSCDFEVLTRYGYTIVNLSVDGEDLINGVICHNNQNILLYEHLNKINGELKFVDTQGSSDPQYDGFGIRWFLSYVR